MTTAYWQNYLGSLTAELERVSCGQLHFTFLQAAFRPLSWSESLMLGYPMLARAWVREVVWRHDEQIHVIAKAIIPCADVPAYQRLYQWGEQPLGHLLYGQSDLREEPSITLSPDPAYALHRCRVLFFQGHPLLLSEQMTSLFLQTWEVAGE